MKYVVNIAMEYGTNTIKELFVNNFDTREEWIKSIDSMFVALENSKCSVEINTIERKGWKVAYIIYKRK